MPPSSPVIKNMTVPEKLWLLTNIYKDEEEDFEKTKVLCKFLRPEAFSEDNDTSIVSDTFIEDIETKLGRKLTEEEQSKIMSNTPENIPIEEDLDIIERIKE